MADIIATLFRFRQFVFEYGPFFLVAWLGLAVTTGLIAASQRKRIDLKAPSSPFLKYRPLRWLWQLLFFLLWRPSGKVPALSSVSGLLLFGLVASVPSLVVTSLISMKAVLLRLVLASLFALSLNWLAASVLPQKREKAGEWRTEVNLTTSALSASRFPSSAQVSWKSFIGQVEESLIPLVIGFSLAAVLTIYIPAFAVRPWLAEGSWQGPYLAALLVMPFQLTAGAEVILASALMIKGASLGTALSIMLVAPSTTFPIVRRFVQTLNLKGTALYLVATWLVAGSLGVAVDGIQRLFSG